MPCLLSRAPHSKLIHRLFIPRASYNGRRYRHSCQVFPEAIATTAPGFRRFPIRINCQPSSQSKLFEAPFYSTRKLASKAYLSAISCRLRWSRSPSPKLPVFPSAFTDSTFRSSVFLSTPSSLWPLPDPRSASLARSSLRGCLLSGVCCHPKSCRRLPLRVLSSCLVLDRNVFAHQTTTRHRPDSDNKSSISV